MKPTIETISKALDACYENTTSLIEEARLLYKAKKYARAYFLSQIAIEEMGKISMLRASVQYPANYLAFWNFFWKLFRNHSYKIGKAEITIQNSKMNFQLNGSEDIFKIAGTDNQIKMESLYVDVKKGEVKNPAKIIGQKKATGKLDEAEKKFTVFCSQKEEGLNRVTTLKLIDNFYSKPKVRKLQKEVLIEQTTPHNEYLKELFKIAKDYEDEPFASILIKLASAITK